METYLNCISFILRVMRTTAALLFLFCIGIDQKNNYF